MAEPLNTEEEIRKLYAKPKTYKIPFKPEKGEKQIDIKVTSLGLENMGDLDAKKDDPMPKIAKSATKLVALSLGISEETAGKISFRYMEDIMICIEKENNFKKQDKESIDTIKGFIKRKNDQVKGQATQESKHEPESTTETQE